MNNQPDILNAYARGLARLIELYKEDKFQSYISSTPDMLSPVESPESLFPRLTEIPQEIFSKLVITDLIFKNKPELKITSDLVNRIKNYQNDEGLFTFWAEPSFPADVDDTTFGLTILAETGQIKLSVVNQVIDKMLNTVDDDGIIRVFFPPFGHRSYLDPAVCVNALYLFSLVDREQEAKKSEDYVFEYLHTQSYLKTIVNYPSPDIFLFFLARLMNKSVYYRKKFEGHVRQSLIPRMGTTELPIEIAARIIAAEAVGIPNELEKQNLIRSQNSNGGWPPNTLFNFHRRRGFFGCEALTTAFAIKALETQDLYKQALSYCNFDAIYEELGYEVPLILETQLS